MDRSMIALILQAQENAPALTWQAFVLANGAFLLALAFWVGVQSNRISNLYQRRREDLEQYKIERQEDKAAFNLALSIRDKELDELKESSQEVMVATLGEKLEHVLDRINMLQDDLDQFQKSVFVEALRISTTSKEGPKPIL